MTRSDFTLEVCPRKHVSLVVAARELDRRSGASIDRLAESRSLGEVQNDVPNVGEPVREIWRATCVCSGPREQELEAASIESRRPWTRECVTTRSLWHRRSLLDAYLWRHRRSGAILSAVRCSCKGV